jgi:hypothetical protein
VVGDALPRPFGGCTWAKGEKRRARDLVQLLGVRWQVQRAARVCQEKPGESHAPWMDPLAKSKRTNELFERWARETPSPTVVRDRRRQTGSLPRLCPQTIKALGDPATHAHGHKLRRSAGQIGIAARGFARGEPSIQQRRRQPHPHTPPQVSNRPRRRCQRNLYRHPPSVDATASIIRRETAAARIDAVKIALNAVAKASGPPRASRWSTSSSSRRSGIGRAHRGSQSSSPGRLRIAIFVSGAVACVTLVPATPSSWATSMPSARCSRSRSRICP